MFVRFLAALAFVVLFQSTASAVIVTAPGEVGVEGNSNSVLPFNVKFVFRPSGGPLADSQRYQQVFTPAAFGGISGLIESIAFRPDRELRSTAQIVTRLDIRLSHTSATPLTLSKTFANNVGPDETVVFDGLFSRFFRGNPRGCPGGCAPFETIDIDDLFVYNGVDNLLLDVRVLDRPTTFATDLFDAVRRFDQTFTGTTALVFSGEGIDSVNRPVAQTKFDLGIITQFSIRPVPDDVPVPAASGIFVVGLGALGLARRRSRPSV